MIKKIIHMRIRIDSAQKYELAEDNEGDEST